MSSNNDSDDSGYPSHGAMAQTAGSFTKSWPEIPRDVQTAVEDRYFQNGATIDFERVPKPQAWYSYIPGYRSRSKADEQKLNHEIIKWMAFNSSVVRRPLGQSEIDAIAESYGNGTLYRPWAGVLALGVSLVAVRNGMNSFRFPFYTPKGKWFNPRAFPWASRPLLKGPAAIFMWHTCRVIAYYVPSLIGSKMFMFSMEAATHSAIYARDPRLHTLRAEMKQRRGRDNATEAPRQKVPQNAQLGGDKDVSEEEAKSWANGAPGQLNSAYDEPETSQTTPQQPWQQQTEPHNCRASLPPKPVPTSEQPLDQESGRWDDDSLVDEDDGSPVSASVRRAERQQQQQQQASQPQTSSWDQLRRSAQARVDSTKQAKAESSATSWSRGDRSVQDTTWGRLRQDSAPTERDSQQTSARREENYTYDSAQESKGYAQSQAQKEFDAMIEAERQGGESTKGGSK